MIFDVADVRPVEPEGEDLVDHLTRLQHVTSALSGDLSPADVIGTIMAQVTTAIGAWAGVAAVVGADGLLHETGGPGRPSDPEGCCSFPLDADNLLAAAGRAQRIQVGTSAEEALGRYPSLRAALAATHSQGLVALPLMVDRRLLGVIAFSFCERCSFAEREIRFFTALAEQCARALDRADAYRRLRQAKAALEDKVQALAEAHERERCFTADMAHDLRNPATAVMSAASVFEEQVEDLPTELRPFLRPLLSGARSMRILLDDLLELTRLGPGRDSVEREPLDLAAVVEGVVGGLPSEPSVWFSAQRASIVSDRRRVIRIVTNLVENALTYGRDGIEVEVRAETDGATVVVRDHGAGIDPEHLEHIFDRYFTTGRTQGTGLGLSIAHENACLVGGTIDARSTPGEVTEFTCRLPSLPFPMRSRALLVESNSHSAPPGWERPLSLLSRPGRVVSERPGRSGAGSPQVGRWPR